jgi:hypothetical protein
MPHHVFIILDGACGMAVRDNNERAGFLNSIQKGKNTTASWLGVCWIIFIQVRTIDI